MQGRPRILESVGRLTATRLLYATPRVTRVLGIESSCDDTGAAVVDDCGNTLGDAIFSQGHIHRDTGGIVPPTAGKLHSEQLPRVVNEALRKSRTSLQDISAIAVTVGPGLALCLKSGLSFAKDFALKTSKPLVPIHHMEAHALTARMIHKIQFPFLVLLVSGGHTLLAIAHSVNEFSRLGSTLDDAVGEAFDKVSRMLRLHCHSEVGHLAGGPAIEELAKRGNADAFKMPLVLQQRRDCDFSFSGLKNAVRRVVIDEEKSSTPHEPVARCEDIAASFQKAAVRHLVKRTHRAILYCRDVEPDARTLVVSGGVASNSYLREELSIVARQFKFDVVCPPPRLCTDNGIMIAWNGVEKLKSGYNPIFDFTDLEYKPRWPLGKDISARVIQANIKATLTKRKQ
ncbi:tRNA N6-adenosine threonylcarbamoyltransferase, mitochondrial-like [Oscarella lobularis]|uniref:tRNA N6-adenosine threonylcarbamoyltransferase, mitochondrial-like n=1 Tax=Oscarella lobularis TaxID=121494 RepID=UPI00331446C4